MTTTFSSLRTMFISLQLKDRERGREEKGLEK
jgi:hypothetical protein